MEKYYNQLHLKCHRSAMLWSFLEASAGLIAFASVFVFFGVLILSQT